MQIIYKIIIFCIVLFLYLHIYFHLKTSNDLEVYEIDQPSKEKLEEICDLRQPVLFDFFNEHISACFTQKSIDSHYGAFDVYLRDTKDFGDETEFYVPLVFKTALHLFETDKESKFLTEHNGDFLTETGLVKNMRYNDSFLRPNMVSSCKYDYITASPNTEMPFRYELSYRTYFYIVEGKITIKLAPPHASRYLYPVKDYDNFEFRSNINPWNVQNQYKADFDKVKCLDVEIMPGKMFFLPAYWWYSMKFSKNTSICSFKYKTYMNTVAILPHICMNLLQRQNTKHAIAKKLCTNTDKDISRDKNQVNNPDQNSVNNLPTVSLNMPVQSDTNIDMGTNINKLESSEPQSMQLGSDINTLSFSSIGAGPKIMGSEQSIVLD